MGGEDPTTHLFSGKPGQNFGGGGGYVREVGGLQQEGRPRSKKKVFLPPPRRFPQSSILLLATENKSLLGPPFSWGPGGWLVGREGEKEENYFPFLGWEGKMEEEDPGPKRPSFSNLMVFFSKNGKFKKRIARGKERQEGSHKLSRLFFFEV